MTTTTTTTTAPATQAISNRMPAIAIEFDSRGKREQKQFEDISKARHFFAAKLNGGKNPKVTAGDETAVTAAMEKPAATVKEEKTAKPTRPFVCGAILAEHGIETAVKELIAKVDREYGKANERESGFALGNARQAIKGWCAAMNLDYATGKPMASE